MSVGDLSSLALARLDSAMTVAEATDALFSYLEAGHSDRSFRNAIRVAFDLAIHRVSERDAERRRVACEVIRQSLRAMAACGGERAFPAEEARFDPSAPASPAWLTRFELQLTRLQPGTPTAEASDFGAMAYRIALGTMSPERAAGIVASALGLVAR